jgi:hypothetical protein
MVAMAVKNDKLGVGTADPSTIGESDDIYEAQEAHDVTAVKYAPLAQSHARACDLKPQQDLQAQVQGQAQRQGREEPLLCCMDQL